MKTAKTQTQKYYAMFRKAGYNAAESLRGAKLHLEFRDRDDLRIVCREEEEDYFSVYGEPDGYTDINGRKVSAEQAKQEQIEQIDTWGCWYVCVERKCPECGSWAVVDSVGMCTGYHDPTSPFDNAYVIDLYAAGLAASEDALCC